ncbi:D-alanine--D-alanine ligase [Candidatus Poribacteria bacterium]|nr:D-alanine--D-alanine ligase [Candidatus Poribacteria bacterium]
MASKINVAVLMGGRTAEHEVSIKTGNIIVKALDKNKYNVKPVIITKQGKWLLPDGYIKALEKDDKTYDIPDTQASEIAPVNTGMALDKAVDEKVDVVFIAMHGPLGEDGTVQGLLELADIPYTGSGVLASSLAMNKFMSRKMFEYEGLLVPKGAVFNVWQWEKDSNKVISQVENNIGFPCVLKPEELGSSVGISIARDSESFKKDFQKALRYSNEVLIEEFVKGLEVTCAVLGDTGGKEPIPLVPTQIVPVTSDFFDYKAKYTPGATEEITPPIDVDQNMIKRIQETAVKAHKVLGCGGMSRTDMIIRDNKLYVLELNTIPGMTELSLYPQAAKAAGIEFSDLLSRLIEMAVETHKNKKRCVDF